MVREPALPLLPLALPRLLQALPRLLLALPRLLLALPRLLLALPRLLLALPRLLVARPGLFVAMACCILTGLRGAAARRRLPMGAMSGAEGAGDGEVLLVLGISRSAMKKERRLSDLCRMYCHRSLYITGHHVVCTLHEKQSR